MSDNNLINLGEGKIKSEMIGSYINDMFQAFKPGSLIITKNKEMYVTVIQVVNCYSSDENYFASIQVFTSEGDTSIYLVIFDKENNKFILNNRKQYSEIVEIINYNSKT